MKPLDHVRITAEAVRQFVRYSQSPVVSLLLQHTSIIQQGSEDADLKPLYTRATNWHFYNRNLDQDVLHEPVWSFMEPLTFHLSSEHILMKRCEQFDMEVAKNATRDACHLMGRILHHIQDMSTPSHVVPVYHGPLVSDSFETYLNKDFLGNNNNLEKVSEQLRETQPSIKVSPTSTVLQLYQESAEQTLEFLKPENSSFQAIRNGRVTNLPWSYFWADRHTHHEGGYPADCSFGGFGTFGPLGKHFGTTGPFTQNGDVYHIEQTVYDQFCTTLVKDMLENSIKTLLLLQPRLELLC